MKVRLVVSALACAALAACSSIIEGTSQEISVNTNPAGADCTLNRQGFAIAHVTPTPGATKIEKTKDDITILCDKDGFEQATYLNHSGADATTVGNIILGGGIGWAIDSASGADNKYDSPVNITLVPKLAAQGETGPTAATQPSGSTEGAAATTAAPQPSGSAQGAPTASAEPKPLGFAPAVSTTATPQTSSSTLEPKQ